MISQSIARRYAKALLALGQEDGNYVRYGEELTAFAQVMGLAGLAETLTNPLYPLESRRQILERILERLTPSRMVMNFVLLVMDKGRIGLVEPISEYYGKLVDRVNNIERATVTAAADLPADLQNRVRQTLERLTGKTILLETQRDSEIIGGIIAQVGDLTLDGSVKTQIKNLKESLIKG